MDSQDPTQFFTAARRLIKGFTWYGTYPEACALVMGYDDGLGRGTVLNGFQKWLTSRQGSAPEVAFWVHVLREAFPDKSDLNGSNLSEDEHAVAVDKLFALLLEYVGQVDSGANGIV